DLLRAVAVRFEGDLAAVRRVARTRVDGVAWRELSTLTGAQIHLVDRRVAAVLQTHDHALPIGREARREGHAGEIADRLALTRLQVQQKHARLIAGIRHERDLLVRRTEARGEHKLLAFAQQSDVLPILVHNGQALHTLLLWTGLVDEN